MPSGPNQVDSRKEERHGTQSLPRCTWADKDEMLIRYHDLEWGIIPSSDSEWLEKIVLETFQAGLSWRTVLHKRENFRHALSGFDIRAVAHMDAADINGMMQNVGLIRNRKKLEAAVENARIALRLVTECGSLEAAFVPFKMDEETLLPFLCRTLGARPQKTSCLRPDCCRRLISRSAICIR